MNLSPERVRLYAITDRAHEKRLSLMQQIEEALKNGVTILQLREKELSDEAFTEEAVMVKEICRKYGVPLIINDRVDVALQSGADGVHVGIGDQPVAEIRKRAGENFIIGATAKTTEQAKAAELAGADYLGVGAVFPSPTKKDAVRITAEQLRAIRETVSIPVVAIGGITSDNLQELAGSRIDGVAVVSAIFGADDPGAASAELLDSIKKLSNPPGKKLKTALSIAGSDSSGGAGIQADIKTMTMNGVYAMTAVTALTAQNTTGVTAISEVSPEFLAKQIEAVFEDIRPDAVKIGMVSSAALVRTIVGQLKKYQAENIVVDPVMTATSGAMLIGGGAAEALKKELLPMARLVTPNIPEAEILSGVHIKTAQDMTAAAEIISSTCRCSVLIKGGHSICDADDLLYDCGTAVWFRAERIDNPNTHGTGCTLSSAITAGLAKGFTLTEAVRFAKEYISGALASRLDLGRGSGPLNHAYQITD